MSEHLEAAKSALEQAILRDLRQQPHLEAVSMRVALREVLLHLEEAARETPATERVSSDSSRYTTGRLTKPSESSPASRGLMNELSALMGRIWAWHKSTGFTEREWQEIQASYSTLKSIYESLMAFGLSKAGDRGPAGDPDSPEPAGIEAAGDLRRCWHCDMAAAMRHQILCEQCLEQASTAMESVMTEALSPSATQPSVRDEG